MRGSGGRGRAREALQVRLGTGRVAARRSPRLSGSGALEEADPELHAAAASLVALQASVDGVAADLELLTGRVEEAFARIVDLVRRTSGDERTWGGTLKFSF